MSHVLVTGGAGFIGSHLVDALLARGDRVRVLDDLSSGKCRHVSPGAELVVGSVADRAQVRAAIEGVDGVFHLAAIASVARCTADWSEAHTVNQSGSVHVLEAAGAAGGIPVVYASSAAIYGRRPQSLARETDTPAPCSPYGCDKLGSELHAGIARDMFGVPAVGLRFFNVYGPRQDGASPYSGVISIFADRLRAGERLALHGGGAQTRDFVFVADVVAALLAAMHALPDLPPAINVCTGRATSVREVATHLARSAGRPTAFADAPARPGDILHSRGDPSLLAATLGLRCDTSIADGLAQLCRAGFLATAAEATVA
jgi:UDP-glucose 4-epimerase